MADTKKTMDYARRVSASLDLIEKRLDEDLTLEELARAAGFSPYHFHRLFTAFTGESLGRVIRRLRLEQAARLLAQSPKRVTDVALEAGFASLEGFERAFAAHFAASPSQYRQASRQGQPLADPARLRGRPVLHTFTNQGVPMQVEIKTFAPLHMISLRHVGPYQDVGPTWGTLCAWAAAKGLFSGDREPVFAGIGYDVPNLVPADELRYDACISVPQGTMVDGDVRLLDVPGGEYAVYLHKGPYSGLAQAYQQFYGVWLPLSGRQLGAHPGLEVYLNTPERTPPQELLTEIRLPLAPQSA